MTARNRPAQTAPPPQTEQVQDDLVSKANRIELRNILKKLNDGKTLNAREAKILEAQKKATAESTPAGDGVVVDTGKLSQLLNLTKARLGQLAAEGILIKAERGRWLLWESVHGYICYLQSRKTGATGEEAKSEYQRQRNRKLQAEADLLELQRQTKQGSLLDATEVRETWESAMIRARREMESWHDISRARRSELSRKLCGAIKGASK